MEIIDIHNLRQHEMTDPDHLRWVHASITDLQVIKRPILVDKISGVILDGHHRCKVLQDLGLTKIPALLVDYESDDITVLPRRKDIPIDKKKVLEMGLSKNVFPSKTTKHIFKHKITDYDVPLDYLH